MNLPPLHPPIATECQIQGDVVVASDVVIAPGVLLHAEPGSRIVVGAGVCFGMGVLLHARGGTIVVEAGATLGAGVLMVGQGTIGAQACVGASTTVFDQSVPAGAIIAPGSVVSLHPQALVQAVGPAGTVRTPSTVPGVSGYTGPSVSGPSVAASPVAASPVASAHVAASPVAASPTRAPVSGSQAVDRSVPSPSSTFNQGFEVWDEPAVVPPVPPRSDPAPQSQRDDGGEVGPRVAASGFAPGFEPGRSSQPVTPGVSEVSRPSEVTESPRPQAANFASSGFGSVPSASPPPSASPTPSSFPAPSAPPAPEIPEPGPAPPRVAVPNGFQFYSPRQAQPPSSVPPSPSVDSAGAGFTATGSPASAAAAAPYNSYAAASPPADSPSVPDPPPPPDPPPKQPQTHRVYGRDYFLQMRWSMFPNHPPPA